MTCSYENVTEHMPAVDEILDLTADVFVFNFLVILLRLLVRPYRKIEEESYRSCKHIR